MTEKRALQGKGHVFPLRESFNLSGDVQSASLPPNFCIPLCVRSLVLYNMNDSSFHCVYRHLRGIIGKN